MRKEAAWVVSNITGGTPDHINRLLATGFGEILVQLLKHEAFDIKKEVVIPPS